MVVKRNGRKLGELELPRNEDAVASFQVLISIPD